MNPQNVRSQSKMKLHPLIVVGVFFLFLPFAWASVDLLEIRIRPDLLEHRHLVTILTSSIVISCIGAFFAVVLGFFVSVAHSHYRLPFFAVWGTLMLVPLICPVTMWSMAQNACFGEGGLINQFIGESWNDLYTKFTPGKYILAVLIFAQITMPLCMLIILRGCRRLQAGGWIAAKHYLTRTKMCLWVIKGLKHEIITSFLLAFSLNLGNFAVPHALQCRLISVEIYSQAINYLDREGAIAASVIILAVAMLPAFLLALIFRRTQSLLQPSETLYSDQKNWRRGLMATICMGYLIIFLFFPVAALFVQCGSISTLLQAIRVSLPEASNSLIIASICAVLAGLLPWAAALVSPKKVGTAWEFFNLWAIGVSPLVIAIVCSRIGSLFGSRIGSITIANAILCYALLLRVWPYAFRILSTGKQEYHLDWQEAARMARIPRLRQVTKIDLPHYLPYVVLTMVIAFSLSIGEIEISQMLCAPGCGTLALRLMTFLHFAPANEVAGLALFQMAVAMTPVFVLFAFWKKTFNIL
jgi:ABC-type Fe3+ transport system permease subunit